MPSMDDVDSRELARATGINPRYCETFRSVIRRFFWEDNQVLRYPVDGGTAIAALIPGCICELYDTGSHVQVSLFPPADPATASWTFVIAESVDDDAALPDDAEVVGLEALHDRLCEHLRPVRDAVGRDRGLRLEGLSALTSIARPAENAGMPVKQSAGLCSLRGRSCSPALS